MLSKRKALVTGASRGIGRAIAVELAAQDHDIALCYRTESDAVTETLRQLEKFEVAVHHAPCDVSDGAAAEAFVDASVDALGEIDVLVNCAGIVKDRPLALMTSAEWHDVIDTNLTGTFNFCRPLSYRFMKNRSGSIVNVSSIAGVYGNVGQTNYAASKAGIHGFSRSLAKEVARYGVRVNVVAPGFVETDMTGDLSEKARKKAQDSIPLRRFGTAEDIAEVVSFLASDRASYVTGQVLQVDGGMVL
ncbi:beta-ketoacyl-ACP reductase [Rhodococcus sp. 06-235-1A]|uniref:3-oxoacyl-[acyl-carrier-protein] reductase n=1 Tax=unclassified Rhodococcus (in: high G+C Gram-positive bacteria) TaxID=192944 RepID=UPI0005D9F310|nr:MULTISPECIES: 3-oxoacyl-[acyl-carrier-protein] reductase [unclassified Rhodococcus (in: high G+C Gram-positive bacteria)]AJW41274.1 3-oxoacyl-[acyl-carrier protein] reductase [Rhodococcus sp. B7740]OZD08141.1 beta-ketoacyl-ACP reductase [Rhodococcus sp. 06-235-1A]